MRCEACGFDTTDDARFCEKCGTPQLNRCPDCSRQLRPTARFCPDCGARADGGPDAATPSAAAAPQAERRQITVLFCDLVASTDLSESLDPEEFREVVRAYQTTCAKEIELHGGYVAQYLGDGLLVYFGFPTAYEDGPYRAVRTGLGIIEALGGLNQRLERSHRLHLAVRIGMHTGLVVVGAMGGAGRQERLALGDTPNIAARLQSLAAPDSVVVSATTAGFVAGRFRSESLGRQTLKGIREPIEVFRIIDEISAPGGPRRHARSATPMIGRDAEWNRLKECWEGARAGSGRAVLLQGEAGIGKSRLVQALLQRADGEVFEFQCSPIFRQRALHPFVEHLQRRLGFGAREHAGSKRQKLQRALEGHSPQLREELPLLAALLGVGAETGPPTEPSEDQGERTYQALLRWLLESIGGRPALIVWEDAHWSDASSLEVLDRLIRQLAGLPVLLLVTVREEFEPPWAETEVGTLVCLEIQRLDPEQSNRMVRELAGDTKLPERVVEELVDRADGVPMFLEELTRMVRESDWLENLRDDSSVSTTKVRELTIPATLQDLLMARLDRFSELKPVLSIAAVLGREFDYELLRDVSSLSDAELVRDLGRLVDADVLVHRGEARQGYLFRHALIQEAAYRSQLRSARRELHRRVGVALERRQAPGAKPAGEVVELLAHHWSHAVDPARADEASGGKAVDYLTQAGEDGLRLSAYPEAMARLGLARELLEPLRETRRRDERELTIQACISTVLKVTTGWSSPEVKEAYDRSRELCVRLGDQPRLAQVLFRLWSFHLVRGEYLKSLEVARECFELATSLQSSALLLEARIALSNSQFWLCRLDESLDNAEQVLRLYDPQLHEGHLVIYGQDPRIQAMMFTVWIPWMQGRPDEAQRNFETMRQLVEELDHPFSTAIALNTACGLHSYRRDYAATQRDAERLLQLSTEHGFPNYQMFGVLFRGWAMAHAGNVEEILELNEQTHKVYATQVGLAETLTDWAMAEIYRRAGRPESALRVVEQGLATSERTQELVYQVELMRIRAELLAELSPQQPEEAEQCMRQAHDLAMARGQAPYALRVATAMVRLARRSGVALDEKKELLASHYERFAGSDEADTQEASRLLAETDS